MPAIDTMTNWESVFANTCPLDTSLRGRWMRSGPAEYWTVAMIGRMVAVGLVGATLSVLIGCTPALHVREVAIKDAVSPTEFATYRWQPGLFQEAKDEEHIDTEYSKVIQQAVDGAMDTRGYTRADDDNEAMILAFQVTIDDVVEGHNPTQALDSLDQTSEYGLRWRLPLGETPVRLERLSPADEVVYFTEGILHVGAFTPEKAPIWHAMGHKILDASHTPAEHRSVLRKTVDRIMQRLPARQLEPNQRSAH